MTPDLLSAIRSLPRDTVIAIEDNPPLARALHGRGHPVVHVGELIQGIPSARSPVALNNGWSALTGRATSAASLGSTGLRDIVGHCVGRADVNGQTSGFRARGWVRNLLENLRHLTRPLAMQLDGLSGVPCFIVGAGSSLDRNYHLLRMAQRRGIVIGVNAAARLPGVDVALTVESNDLRYKLGPLKHVGLRAFGMTAAPEVMAHGEAPLVPVYSGELGMLLESITGEPKLACSANGGTAAVSLAERWGCSPIVLVGHDFAVGERVYPSCLGIGETKTRRDGDVWRFDWAPELRAQPRHNPLNEAEPYVEVPGLDGSPIGTTMVLAGARHWYESAAEEMPAKCINASEWGASLAGWDARTLESVLAELPERGYEVHAPAGLDPEALVTWLDSHIAGNRAVENAAQWIATAHDVWPGLGELERKLRVTPLVEPWCQSAIADVLRQRRSEPPNPNQFAEMLASAEHARQIAAIVARETPDLTGLLVAARANISTEMC